MSFVVVARNDGYGGDFLGRMQRFVDRLLGFLIDKSAQAELLVVEWNPPPQRARIAEAVKWPALTDSVEVRIVEVPATIHDSLPNSAAMPVFEYIGKNVGIRRAAGEFVVATNPDLIYPSRLVELVCSDRLDRRSFYRVNRLDLVSNGSRERVEAVHTRFGALSTAFPYVTIRNARRVAGFMRQWALVFPRWPPHTAASGDFLMMARAAWHDLRGYPEIPTHSFIDGYMCYAAKSSGLKEVVPRRTGVYHLDHGRAEQESRPLSDIRAYRTRCREMMRTGAAWRPNGPDWGLAGLELKETRIA